MFFLWLCAMSLMMSHANFTASKVSDNKPVTCLQYLCTLSVHRHWLDSCSPKRLLATMPKLAMKYRGGKGWPIMPKRGKKRSSLKRPASAMKSMKKFKPVPYVRTDAVQKKFRKERNRFGVSVPFLMSLYPGRLIKKLVQDGILPDWEGRQCPHCATGVLGALHYFKEKKVWTYRCSKKGCQQRIQPHDFHPIFFRGAGSQTTSLGCQAAILCCALAGVPVTSVPVILDMNEKPVYKIYQNLEITRARHVECKQSSIKYGKFEDWCDLEADEVDVGKELFEENTSAKWEQWGGIVARGRPESLSLFRLNPKTTSARAPGPGPIRRRDWKPFAEKHLRGAKVILYTDGARAYKLKVPEVVHDNVVHQKNGSW